jgi:putative restriction endonuclease
LAVIWRLFQESILTITTNFKEEISNRIKEEFENGRDYYKFHGGELHTLPSRLIDTPQSRFIEWHNENVYKG